MTAGERSRQGLARVNASSVGFTLIEMLLVVLLTGIVLSFAASFHLDVSAASRSALERTVEVRRATSVLDRVSKDLESAVLVKKPESIDPLAHPWVFLAEASGRGTGADRLKFQARNHRPRAALGHESDLVVIAYWLSPSEDGQSLELLRWTSPQLPESLDRSFPRRDDPGVEVLASHVAAFGVQLQDDAGAWSDTWDSSTVVRSGELPVAARVSLSLLPEQPAEDEPALAVTPPLYDRPVLLALRPLDLEETLEGEEDEAGKEEEEEAACVTVAECIARNQASVEMFLANKPEFRAVLEGMGDQCWADHAASLPLAVTNCL